MILKKIDWQAWVEDWKKRLLYFTGKGEKWGVWGGAQAGFESIDLMTQGIKEQKLMWFVGETEMDDLGVLGILGPERFEWQIESCRAVFVKELDLNE